MTSAEDVRRRTAVIVEDDADISELLRAILQQAGFDCHLAATGGEGVRLVREQAPVLTTLDVSLPDYDGLEVVRQIRSFSDTYVIILSGKDEETDILMGLGAGADDYVSKPFRPREVRARVEAMLRRRDLWLAQLGAPSSPAAVPSPAPAPAPTVAPVTTDAGAGADEVEGSAWLGRNGMRVHPEMRLCEVDGRPVELTRSEFDLLLAIVRRDRRVASKEVLVQELRHEVEGSWVSESDRRSVEVHLANLRRKLGDSAGQPRFIETVRGVGYRLAARRA
ncbi:response regulator transcription factor [Desertihabitans aurantiacus]|uniref:response regulator transcription factor n=1 Tax=Desertihabitans aurantiacus TaxID=2282477 RepID=UPI000DF744B1|nr:response regulator transcription factor [Desertihabitans aurantiacus]